MIEVPAHEVFILRLYVTGNATQSVRAVENLQRICDDHLRGRHELEVIDIYQRPEASRAAQILAVPTLIKLQPNPVRRIIGDLSDRAKVLAALTILPVGFAAGRPGSHRS